MSLEYKEEDNKPVVIAEKTLHKGACMGHISNGGGIVDIGNGKSIKFTALNEKFVVLQIIETGIGTPIKTQSWTKSKVVNKTIIKEKIVKVKDKTPKEKELDNYNISEDRKVLF